MRLVLNDTLEYTIVALNNGTDTLNHLSISDPLITPNNVSCGGPILPGDSCVLTGFYVVDQDDVDEGDITNRAIVNSNESARDTAELVTIIPQHPKIAIIKSSELNLGQDGISNPGDTITYFIKIANTGNVSLNNIDIIDTLFSGIGGLGIMTFDSSSLGSTSTHLKVNEKAYWSVIYTITQGDIDIGFIENQAEVEAIDPKGNTIRDKSDTGNNADANETGAIESYSEDDPTSTIIPASASAELIKISELSSDDPVMDGDTILYSFTITNNGNVTLSNVTVSDPLIPNNSLECNDGVIAPNQSTKCEAWYILDQNDIDKGLVKNSAVVFADLPNGRGTVQDTSDTGNSDHPYNDNGSSDSTLTMILPMPNIELIKNIKTIIDNGDSQITVGDTVVYSFEVRNIGNVTLYDINIQDTLVTPSGGPISVFTPGAIDSTTFTAKYVITSDDMIRGYVQNSASATARPNLNNFFYSPDGPIGGLPPLVSDVSDTGNPVETPDGDGNFDGRGDNDPVVLNICQPSVSSCPVGWDVERNFDGNTCMIESPYSTVSEISNDYPSFIANNCGSDANITITFTDAVIPSNCFGNGTAYFNERKVNRTYVFTNSISNQNLGSCTLEITYNISECVSLTDFGVISIDSDYNSSGDATTFTLTSGCDAPPIVEVADVSGKCGYVEYMWLRSTRERSPGIPFTPNELIVGAEGSGAVWEIINGALDKGYNPMQIAENTYFVRCARNFGCCNFGESNIISFIVDAGSSCPIPNNPFEHEDCGNKITLLSPSDDGEDGDFKEYRTNESIIASNIIRKGSDITFKARDSIVLLPGFEVDLNAQLTISLDGCEND